MRHRRFLASSAVLLATLSPSLEAQRAERRPPPAAFEAFAGGELEGYLRALQNRGRIGPHPWSVRAFSPGEVRTLALADSLHPWGERYPLRPPAGRVEAGFLRPRAELLYNSGFPHGGNDGPLWAGRGLTSSVRLGAFARWGPLSLVLAPTAFRAENRSFALARAGSGDPGVYLSPLAPGSIDLPQRFGPDPYARVDPGNSTLRLDVSGLSLGVSTAAQQWGPMGLHPLVLGPNAGGFPHLFLGTSRPLNLWIGKLHGRFAAGRLEQSPWSPVSRGEPRRLMTGFVATFTPRGVSGLEVGATRFFHNRWPADGVELDDLWQPFEAFFKRSIPDADTRAAENQLASLFVRWNVPGAGFEIFGEFVREDHATDLRVLVMEPDDLSGYALGVRRVWGWTEASGPRLHVLRAEVLSTISSHRARIGSRGGEFSGFPLYVHTGVNQGHTHRGQLLASPAGAAGTALTVGVDHYHPRGRWTVELDRTVERDRTTGRVEPGAADADVRYTFRGEALRFTGPLELSVGVAGVYNLNRYLQDDAFNLNLRLGATASLW